MTSKVLEFIANETNGKCYQSFRYCADDEIRMPTLDYEDKGNEFSLVKNSCGETDTSLKTTKSIKETAKKIINDNYLVMKGAMSPWDMESLVKEHEEFGLVGVVEKNGVEQWQDFCVVEWRPTLPCDWIVVKNEHAYHKSDPEQHL